MPTNYKYNIMNETTWFISSVSVALEQFSMLSETLQDVLAL